MNVDEATIEELNEERSISPLNFAEQVKLDEDWKPDSDGDDSDAISEILNTTATRNKRKRGKKCEWATDDLDDFVDIIISGEASGRAGRAQHD